MDYQQITFNTSDEAQRELLLALLGASGYEAFEERDESFLAFIPVPDFNGQELAELAGRLDLSYTVETIPRQNWNELWERDFQPVVVPDFCTVRAGFHPPQGSTPYEIIITPKMSFGTGHHATTQLMIESLKERSLEGQKVLDFGTGTGVLAILAHKLGAAEVLAIDHDEWSVTNARENAQLNEAETLQIVQGSLELAEGASFHLILANINRHILLQYMEDMGRLLLPGGLLVLSGILTEDEAVVHEAATRAGLAAGPKQGLNNWLCLSYTAPTAAELVENQY